MSSLSVRNWKSTLGKLCASPHFPWMLALLASFLALPSLLVGFQLDDYWHQMIFRGFPGYPGLYSTFWDQFTFANGDIERTQRFMDYGFFPWWHALDSCTQPWRPVGALTHWADLLLWPNSPLLMHLQSLAWFAAMVAAAAVFYRRVHGVTAVAALAALMFALDDAHGWAVGWLANRNAVLSTLFGVLALIAHDKWRRDDSRGAALLAPVFLAIAMLSAEAALAVVPYLVGYALFLEEPRTASRFKRMGRQLVTLSPYIVVMLTWQVLYKLLGMGSWGLDLYIDPGKEPVRFLWAAAERLPFLLLGQWALPPSDLYASMTQQMSHWFGLGAAAVVLAIAAAIFPVLWRDRTARFWALGMFGSAIPVSSTLPQDRLLFFVGLGAFGLLAQFLAIQFGNARTDSAQGKRSRVRKIRRAAAFLLLFIHVPLAAIALPIRSYSPVVMDQVVETIRTAPSESSFANKTVVLVNAPSHFYAMYLPVILTLDGRAAPQCVRTLAPNPEAFSFQAPPMTIRRTDANTLLVKPEGGYEARPVLRSSATPFHKGDTVRLQGATVEIVDIRPEGNPGEVAFRFSEPLDSTSYVFLEWKNGALVPFTLLAVGETRSLP